MVEKKRVVLVGHCGPDASMLRSAVHRAAPGAEVSAVNDDAGVERATTGADLLLINRVLDGDFDSEGGIDLIRKLAGGGARLMLVSNYADAQAEAERAGAVPGIGKTTLNDAESLGRIRRALGAG